MDVILFIVGVFLIWQGQMQVSKKISAWPKSKKTGRIIGGVLLMPFTIGMLFVFFTNPTSTKTIDQINLNQNTTYIDKTNGFKILPPQGWITNKNPKYGLIAFMDSGINANSSLTVESGPTNLKLDDFATSALSEAQKISGFSVISKSKTIFNGMEYYLIETKAKVANNILHTIQLVTVTNSGKGFIVTGISSDSVWNKYKSMINNSLLTFTVL